MQPQITVALGLASGVSIVTESIFENRFKYIDELVSMGANIKVEGSTAIISGEEKYTGAHIVAPDLRAGAALVIAGLSAEGITVVDDIGYILRGYEDFDEKLRLLGAAIEGRKASWASRFCFSEFRQGKVSLFPVRSLVDASAGFDGSGTHCPRYNRFRFDLDSRPGPFRFPDSVDLIPSVRRSALRYHSIPLRAWTRLRNLFA
jgi:hypothetical protein